MSNDDASARSAGIAAIIAANTPLRAGQYAGNSTLGFDADEHAPTAILRCPFCAAEIAFYGDMPEHHIPLTLTLESDEYYACTCGAVFGEGNELELVIYP